jgi:formamidopyrimidine-DNA glycosylase
MPELPEVEVTRRSFASTIIGSQIRAVRLGKPLRWPLGIEPVSLIGCTVGEPSRRGKYLWLPLGRDASGAPPTGAGGRASAGGLLIHLGMSGSLGFAVEMPPAGPHDHFEMATTAGTLRLTDPRRFGAVVWSAALADEPAARLLGGLGIEPFDAAFDGLLLWRALKRRRVAVKQALLGGDIVVGAGNIYACEALFRAGIDPRTRSDRLSRARCDRLAAELRTTLAEAVEVGGSTLRNFSDAHGRDGAFQLQAKVYGREGQPCVRCGGTLRRIVQAQRSTYFCPRCQVR